MTSPDAHPEEQERGGLSQGTVKKPRACVHCHVRKVRCDAWQVGTPCTRCRRRNEANTCVLVETFRGDMAKDSARRRRILQYPPYPSQSRSHDATRHVDPSPFSSSLPLPDLGQQRGHVTQTQPALLQETIIEASRQGGHEQPIASPSVVMSVANERATSNGTATEFATREEDVLFRICEDISPNRQEAISPTSQPESSDRREVMELHEGWNPMTILGEALCQQNPNRFVKLMVQEDGSKFNSRQPNHVLDAAETAYLEAKGALEFPRRPVCDELLRLYFVYVYPYAPILDRVKFMQAYRAGHYSPFVLQSILANVVPCAPIDLLRQAGYKDRLTAQKSYYTKATLLYDLKCERNQLYMLQGSIILSSLSFPYVVDKDSRYWLGNAGRIASQIGLHRNYVCESLAKRPKRLFRRIWWVLNNRDVLLAISGIDNLRRFNEKYCDTAPLTESDWEEDGEIPDELRDTLGPVTLLQKLFMVEYSKISIISGHFIRDFKTLSKTPSQDEIEQLSNQITAWRKQLPVEIILALQDEWASDNVLVLVLLAMGYRLEAVFCRAAKDLYRSRKDPASVQRMAKRQENAMFELSTLIQRASMHEALHLCHSSFMTCVSTILAMRIELALDPSITPRKLAAMKTQIFAELDYVRESCEYWSSLVGTVRMFDVILARTRLNPTVPSPNAAPEGGEGTTSTHALRNSSNSQGRQTADSENEFPEGNHQVDFSFPMADELFGMLPMTEKYDWLERIFGTNATEATDDALGSIS